MRYLIRFALLCVAAAMTSFGLAYWQHTGFTMEGFWLVDNNYRPHPVHILALGLAMIPTTIWEIFLLDANAPQSAPSASGVLGEGHPRAPGARPRSPPMEQSPRDASAPRMRLFHGRHAAKHAATQRDDDA